RPHGIPQGRVGICFRRVSSSQLFAICCVPVTYCTVPCSTLSPREMGNSSGSNKMKLQFQRWSERPRIFLLMLAVMLPAAALIAFSVIHLRQIQREKVIEAAFRVDYQQFLAIAEKQIDHRAYEVAEEARTKFPDIDGSDELDSFLTTH